MKKIFDTTLTRNDEFRKRIKVNFSKFVYVYAEDGIHGKRYRRKQNERTCCTGWGSLQARRSYWWIDTSRLIPAFSRLAASIGQLSQRDSFSQKVRWIILKGRWRDRVWSYSVIYGWLVLRVARAFYFASSRHGRAGVYPIFTRTPVVFAVLCFLKISSLWYFFLKSRSIFFPLIQWKKKRTRRTNNSRVNSFNFREELKATKARRKQSWKFSSVN